MSPLDETLIPILDQMNPWWTSRPAPSLPSFRRTAFKPIYRWLTSAPMPRALFVAGARRVGKTVLLRQVIAELLASGVPPAHILYVSFDHPATKRAGFEGVVAGWQNRTGRALGPVYIFADEIQYLPDWPTVVKHQVDFYPDRRLAFSGSALPLARAGRESGVGRWKTLQIFTLSFFEYVQLKGIALPALPSLQTLDEIESWSSSTIHDVRSLAADYTSHFHEYLVRGGFFESALASDVVEAQTTLREDIVDRILKDDIVQMFSTRRIYDLEQLFFYLTLRNGQEVSLTALSNNIGSNRPTVEQYLAQLEAGHLILRILPLGYGKDVLRGRAKVYMTDPAIASAVLMKENKIITSPQELGEAVEAAVVKHFVALYKQRGVLFSFWRNKKQEEVDLVMQRGEKIVACEVKYRLGHADKRHLGGLRSFFKEKEAAFAVIATQLATDFAVAEGWSSPGPRLLYIPAPVLCYWLGEMAAQGHGDSMLF